MFLILLYDNKFVQFLYTGSRFLKIMIAHNVDFCKNELRVIPLTIFHLHSTFYTIDDDENDKTIFITFVKN